MDDKSRTQAWLHHLGSIGPFAECDVAQALKQAGVDVEPLDPAAPSGAGVLLCPDLSPPVCEFVRALTRNGLHRLLAVTTSAAMAGGTAWQILAAGASDVLALDRLHDPAGMIAARLQRWRAVDDLVASPLIREHLVGQSYAWISLLRQVAEVARFTEASVLLVGETGTGKELVARMIHALTPQRHKRDLVVLDCTTIVPDLSGSELFGHERGAFTGAVAARDGAFALANGGTLFLDEVGELPPGLQAQFLRVIQERTYKRVGSNTWHNTDFRLVCASNRDLSEEQEQGRFRRDLYYRIALWVFRLPPLRDRLDDILPLACHFIQEVRPDEEPLELDEPVRSYLLARQYPGNVRDLRNLALRIVHRHVGKGPITMGDVPADERPVSSQALDGWRDESFEQAIDRAVLCGASLKEIRRAAEETAIRAAVSREDGNLQRAAQCLGVTDRALQMRRAEQRKGVQAMAVERPTDDKGEFAA